MAPTHTEQVQQLFVHHAGLVHAYVAGLCGDLALADDIVQDTFLVVTRRAADFALGSDFAAWARAIARLKTLEHLRARRRGLALSDEALAALEAAAPDLDAWQAQREALQRCLARLTPTQRRLAELAYGEGLRPHQIASRLARSGEVVHTLLSRLRRALRACVLRRLGTEAW